MPKLERNREEDEMSRCAQAVSDTHQKRDKEDTADGGCHKEPAHAVYEPRLSYLFLDCGLNVILTSCPQYSRKDKDSL